MTYILNPTGGTPGLVCVLRRYGWNRIVRRLSRKKRRSSDNKPSLQREQVEGSSMHVDCCSHIMLPNKSHAKASKKSMHLTVTSSALLASQQKKIIHAAKVTTHSVVKFFGYSDYRKQNHKTEQMVQRSILAYIMLGISLTNSGGAMTWQYAYKQSDVANIMAA